MELTSEQKMQIERLYENESLTDNLTDADARAVLQWAQQQILAATDGEMVAAAVRAANESGETGVAQLVAQADTFLAHELEARGMNGARDTSAASPTMLTESDASTPVSSQSDASTPMSSETDASQELNARPVSPNSAQLQASGAASEQRLLTAQADATMAPDPTPPPPTLNKSRGKTKRRQKK